MKTSTLITNVNNANTSVSCIINGINYHESKNLEYFYCSFEVKWDLEIDIYNNESIVDMSVNVIDIIGSITIEDSDSSVNETFYIDSRKDSWTLEPSVTRPIEYPCHPQIINIDFDTKKIEIQFYN
jgi:hypothetical protein